MNILSEFESNSIAGLGTSQFTVVTPNAYHISCESFLSPPSGLVITIQHNGSTIATNDPVVATSLTSFVDARIYTAASDTLSIILSSSTPSDSIPNTLRSLMIVTQI